MTGEPELARLRQQLQQTQGELDAFAQALAHDLRAPLRHIQGFAGLLERETAGSLSPKAQSHLRTIQGSAAAMDRLIAALAEFARTSQAPLQPRTVELSPLVAELAASLGAAAGDRRLRWEVTELPPVAADPQLLRRLLGILLENAVKFTAEREEALIRVRAELDPDEIRLLVEDNGCGFQPGHADRLFAPFQRLHATNAFPGLGMGLALARRIVLRHGGRIWANGAPGRGATFAFALPKRT